MIRSSAAFTSRTFNSYFLLTLRTSLVFNTFIVKLWILLQIRRYLTNECTEVSQTFNSSFRWHHHGQFLFNAIPRSRCCSSMKDTRPSSSFKSKNFHLDFFTNSYNWFRWYVAFVWQFCQVEPIHQHHTKVDESTEKLVMCSYNTHASILNTSARAAAIQSFNNFTTWRTWFFFGIYFFDFSIKFLTRKRWYFALQKRYQHWSWNKSRRSSFYWKCR